MRCVQLQRIFKFKYEKCSGFKYEKCFIFKSIKNVLLSNTKNAPFLHNTLYFQILNVYFFQI